MQIPVLEGSYQAVQFHTHIGSEHVIGGKQYGSELHIVHKELDGSRYAVLGVMIDGDASYENPTFQRLLDGWSAVEQNTLASCGMGQSMASRPVSPAANFDVYSLIPQGSSFYHYDGSLTTPPCSEVVWWEVADRPMSVSPAQYERLMQMTQQYTDPTTCEITTAASPIDGTTNRPVVQDLDGRKVTRICPVDNIVDPGSGMNPLLASNGPSSTTNPFEITGTTIASMDDYVGL